MRLKNTITYCLVFLPIFIFGQSKVRYNPYPIKGPVSELLVQSYLHSKMNQYNEIELGEPFMAYKDYFSNNLLIKREYLTDPEAVLVAISAKVIFEYNEHEELIAIKEYLKSFSNEMVLKSETRLFYSNNLLDCEISTSQYGVKTKYIYNKEFQKQAVPLFECTSKSRVSESTFGISYDGYRRISEYKIQNGDTVIYRLTSPINENTWKDFSKDLKSIYKSKLRPLEIAITNRDQYGNALQIIDKNETDGSINLTVLSYTYNDDFHTEEPLIANEVLALNWQNKDENIALLLSDITNRGGFISFSQLNKREELVSDVNWYDNLKDGKKRNFDWVDRNSNVLKVRLNDSVYLIQLNYTKGKLGMICNDSFIVFKSY